MTGPLLFVEDPGAANYVAPLPAALERRGVDARLLACGAALDFLQQRNVDCEASPNVTAAELLNAHRPSLLVVGTSENVATLAHDLVAEARQTRVPTVAVVDTFANAEHRFKGRSPDPLAHVPDQLIVPDERTRRAFVALGMSAERVHVCGHPHHDEVSFAYTLLASGDRTQTRRRLFPGAGSRPVVVFASEISTGLNPEQYRRSFAYTLLGRGARQLRTEIVLEEFIDAIGLLPTRPWLVLRLHPKNQMSDVDVFLGAFDQVDKGGSPLELLWAADLVVGMTSMLLLEAALLGTRQLAILPRPVERDWLPASDTPCVTTRAELNMALQAWSSGAMPAPVRLSEPSAVDRVCDCLVQILARQPFTTIH